MAKTRSADAVRVEGLNEFQAALKAVDAMFPRELQRANKSAAELIAAVARGRAEALGGVSAHVAPSIKAAAEQRFAKVNLGGAKYPEAFGAIFGALHDVERQTPHGSVLGWNQFALPVGRGNDPLFKTIKEERPAFMALYEHTINELAARAFPDGSHQLEVS